MCEMEHHKAGPSEGARLEGSGDESPQPAPAQSEDAHYRFFNHASCEFYPCHDMPAEELNCLFCFCPLYALGDACGGNFHYVGDAGDIKDCSACTVPHRRENYDYLMSRFAEIQRLAAPGAQGA